VQQADDSKQIDMESIDLQALRIDARIDARIDTNHDAEYFFSILACCSKELGVRDLARIAASSKSLKEACVAVARRDFHRLLGAAVAQAPEAAAECSAADSRVRSSCGAGARGRSRSRSASKCSAVDSASECSAAESASEAAATAASVACNSSGFDSDSEYADPAYQQHVHAIAWLLRAAPVEAASDAAVECVLSMPAVPQQAAMQLVTAGMRVSFALLISAVDRMVKGVEVWVLAQERLGVQTDIPDDAYVICLGCFWRFGSLLERWVSCAFCYRSSERLRWLP
jgi:hypothetical protein